jgi:hypothetical protein
VTALLKEKEDELHLVCIGTSYPCSDLIKLGLNHDMSYLKLAHALVEHETLNLEEVKKVIRGEPIRDLTAKLLEVEEADSNLAPSAP